MELEKKESMEELQNVQIDPTKSEIELWKRQTKKFANPIPAKTSVQLCMVNGGPDMYS